MKKEERNELHNKLSKALRILDGDIKLAKPSDFILENDRKMEEI